MQKALQMETPVVRLAIRSLIVFTCLVTATVAFSQQRPSRLVVANNGRATAEVFTVVNQTWQSRGRVSPGASLPVYNVVNGQRFRAVSGSQTTDHTVQLTFDRAYGGWQDVLQLR